MQSQQIKISIANREYNLRVSPEDVPLLEKAAALLKQRLQEKQERMRIYDKQDLLAMVAFDGIVEELATKETISGLSRKVEELTSLIPEQSP
ncbi:MAG: cell division protein ZapA [Cytophagales bacterium]|nr:cell division protein ZapA [Bernardetiaceae bacterium]MDW8210774.1 cell division protein ZapA [Cytophagales bacterium]